MTEHDPIPNEPRTDRFRARPLPVGPPADCVRNHPTVPPPRTRRRPAARPESHGRADWPGRRRPPDSVGRDRGADTTGPPGAVPGGVIPRTAHRFGHGEGRHGDGDHGGGDPDGDGSDGTGVLAAVRERAAAVHERLAHDHGVFAVELVGSTGGGKTALAEQLIDRWTRSGDDRVGVICGDVAGEDDARRYREHGVPVANVTTGKDCHLDPGRVADALDAFDLDRLDTLVVENVGNMVCPADFPLGATVRVLVVSPTEGDDVVRKHPLLFQAVDVAVCNKVDIADAVGADVDRMVADAREVAPDLPVVRTSAETGRGVEDLAATLRPYRDHDHQHA